ncbi:MAG: hypothetical protein CL778_01235 [Chloroflexi bacterium]|nr:hypothetical protein [Chloroflexota bacterium]|tara:strand:- start:21720 stop:22049 length:330 start_codon:yes stop_codon:yes gene_type:complete
MYVLRRIYETKPGMASKVAALVYQQANVYTKSGQRGPTKIYFNGGTVPGTKNIVVMEWHDENIQSPYRGGNKIPKEALDIGGKAREFVVDQYIEFFELLTEEKYERFKD